MRLTEFNLLTSMLNRTGYLSLRRSASLNPWVNFELVSIWSCSQQPKSYHMFGDTLYRALISCFSNEAEQLWTQRLEVHQYNRNQEYDPFLFTWMQRVPYLSVCFVFPMCRCAELVQCCHRCLLCRRIESPTSGNDHERQSSFVQRYKEDRSEGFPRTRRIKSSCACDCGRGPVSSFFLLSSSLTQNRAF